jgi:hypothetical protein
MHSERTLHVKTQNFSLSIFISVSVNNDTIRYELFNHWYALSYAEIRQISIPVSELEQWNQNDSIRIEILKTDNIKLQDNRYNLNRKIKHKNLCVSTEIMRKIVSKAEGFINIHPLAMPSDCKEL